MDGDSDAEGLRLGLADELSEELALGDLLALCDDEVLGDALGDSEDAELALQIKITFALLTLTPGKCARRIRMTLDFATVTPFLGP